MLETVQKPYEFLARWDDDGQFQGAHAVFIECTVVDGVVIAKKLGVALTPQQAADLDFPFSDVLAQLQSDALLKCSTLEVQVADLERTVAELKQAPPATAPELAAKDAIIQDLMAQLEAANSAA